MKTLNCILLLVFLLISDAIAEEMKKLTYSQVHNLSKIGSELMTAFPAWRVLDSDGFYHTAVSVSGDGKVLTLWVPANADEAAIKAIITAHDPTPLPKGMSKSEKARQAIDSATTLNELKAVIKDKLIN